MAKEQTSPPLVANATVIPVAHQVAADVSEMSSFQQVKRQDVPKSPRRDEEGVIDLATDSDSEGKPAQSPSLIQFYSTAQLSAMQSHVQKVRDLTQYMIRGEQIDQRSVSQRVFRQRKEVRKQVLVSLALLTKDLHSLFPCLA